MLIMNEKEYEEKYGKTKLDHVLSHFMEWFIKGLEFTSILFLPLLVVQQLVIYGSDHPDQIISLLLVLMIIATAYAVKLIKDWRRK